MGNRNSEPSYYSKPLLKIHADFKGICALCGRYVEIEEASRDHIIPRSQGGGNGRDNIQLTHKRCNNMKGDVLYPVDWQEQLKRSMIIPKGYCCAYCSQAIEKWQKDKKLITQAIRNGKIIAIHTWCNEERVKYGSF
jgi:hypothetical protein